MRSAWCTTAAVLAVLFLAAPSHAHYLEELVDRGASDTLGLQDGFMRCELMLGEVFLQPRANASTRQAVAKASEQCVLCEYVIGRSVRALKDLPADKFGEHSLAQVHEVYRLSLEAVCSLGERSEGMKGCCSMAAEFSRKKRSVIIGSLSKADPTWRPICIKAGLCKSEDVEYGGEYGGGSSSEYGGEASEGSESTEYGSTFSIEEEDEDESGSEEAEESSEEGEYQATSFL